MSSHCSLLLPCGGRSLASQGQLVAVLCLPKATWNAACSALIFLLLCRAVCWSNLITDLTKIPINSIDHRVALLQLPACMRAPALLAEGLDEAGLGPQVPTHVRDVQQEPAPEAGRRKKGKRPWQSSLKFLPLWIFFLVFFFQLLCSFSLTRLLHLVSLLASRSRWDIRKDRFIALVLRGAGSSQQALVGDGGEGSGPLAVGEISDEFQSLALLGM